MTSALFLSSVADLQTYTYLFVIGAAALALVIALVWWGVGDWIRFVRRSRQRLTVVVITAVLIFQVAFWALFVAGISYGIGLHTGG